MLVLSLLLSCYSIPKCPAENKFDPGLTLDQVNDFCAGVDGPYLDSATNYVDMVMLCEPKWCVYDKTVRVCVDNNIVNDWIEKNCPDCRVGCDRNFPEDHPCAMNCR